MLPALLRGVTDLRTGLELGKGRDLELAHPALGGAPLPEVLGQVEGASIPAPASSPKALLLQWQ